MHRRASQSPPLTHSFWIEPGKLLAGEYPSGPAESDTQARIAALLDAGVTYFLNLTQSHELPPYVAALPRASVHGDITHRNMPLVDHGLPSSPSVVIQILDDLDHALAQGNCVYVHCRAGIGRTNLIIGCWLKRQGMSGKSAVKHLNQLWKSNARSASWPRVPEAHQEKYVLSFDPAYTGVEGPTLRIGISDRERYFGAVLGMACGDAHGAARVQRGHAESVWTDDTAMMLCLAQSLLEDHRFDPDEQLGRYVRWQREGYLSSQGTALGLTPLVAKALAMAAWSGKVFAGSHDPQGSDPQALGRVGAVVLFDVKHPAEAIDWAAEAARITHQAPSVLDACRYFAALLLAALEGAPKHRLLHEAARILMKAHGKPLKAPVAALAAAEHFPAHAETAPKHGAANVLHRVLWAIGQSNDFRAGLLASIEGAAFPDVTGAVYGLLAGSIYGAEAIPQSWRAGIARSELLADVAQRLSSAALLRL